jgi:hypothetical protein
MYIFGATREQKKQLSRSVSHKDWRYTKEDVSIEISGPSTVGISLKLNRMTQSLLILILFLFYAPSQLDLI